LADAIIEEYANKQMKELLEWLKEYRLNTMSLMRIGDYEQGQIDVLTDVINRVDPNRCSYCGKEGFHKLSCTNNTGAIKMSVSSEDFHLREIKQRRCKNHVWRKDFLNGGKKCQVCGKAKEEPKMIVTGKHSF